VLAASHVSFAYGASPVLDDVTVEVPHRAVLGILGPNGSGKTTLLKLLSGSLTPSSGEVTLGGRALARLPRRDLARRVAVVPQETHLAFDYSVLEIALMGRYPWLGAFEIEGPSDLAAATEALEATGTVQFMHRAFPTLSGGEKQRVVIASALAQLDDRAAPRAERDAHRVLLLDEPTASLDLRYQLEIGALVGRLHEERDVTIVLSSHDLRLVGAVCSSVLLLSHGRVLAAGPVRELLTPDIIGELYEVPADLAAPLLP
jgi:iron complex transport system ATP-binding protein